MLLQSRKAEDDLEEKQRELAKRCSEQETELEELRRRVTQLERERDQMGGVCVHVCMRVCDECLYHLSSGPGSS